MDALTSCATPDHAHLVSIPPREQCAPVGYVPYPISVSQYLPWRSPTSYVTVHFIPMVLAGVSDYAFAAAYQK